MLLWLLLSIGLNLGHAEPCGDLTFAGRFAIDGPGDTCVDTSLARATFRALEVVASIRFADGLEKEGVLPAAPLEFFAARVRRLVLDETNSQWACLNNGLAAVSPNERSEGVIYICGRAKSYSRLVVALALVHEARHLDGPQFAHQVCQRGDLSGQFACDESYEQQGSYGVGAEFLGKILKSPALPAEMRARARQLLAQEVVTHFNELPFGFRTGALLRAADDHYVFFDGETLTAMPELDGPGFVTRVGGLATRFGDGEVRTDVFLAELERLPSDVLSDRYRALAPVEIRGVYYGSEYACLLLAEALDCVDRQRQPFRVDLGPNRAARFLFSPRSYTIASGVLHLQREDGRLLVLPASAEDLKAAAFEKWTETEHAFPYQALQPWRLGEEIALDLSGEVRLFERRAARWSTPALLAGQKFTRLIAPFAYGTLPE